MYQKLKPNLLIALIFTLMTLGQQYGFYAVKSLPIEFLPFGKCFALFCFMLFFSFAKGPKTRFFLLSLIFTLNYFQMSHLSYFGTKILPTEIYLLFTQFNEVSGALKEELYHLWIPLLFTIAPLVIGWKTLKKFPTHYQWRAVPILAALYFIYNPVRTYVTGNTWGRQPSDREFSGMNVYLSTSYFLGKILPHKIKQCHLKETNSSLQLKIDSVKESQWDKIIVVLGESLTPHHMEIFGYKKPTTPYLAKLQRENPHFFHTIGLSSGVSTDISVAFFLNMGFGAAGSMKAATGQHCLFKMAKSQNFETHFLSIQSSDQLRYISPYICNSVIDDYRSLEDISPWTEDHQAARDRDLLPSLEIQIDDDEKKFIVLHQRGSHAPWNLRSTLEAQIFKPSKDEDKRITDYDNSVVEFDLFWRDLNKLLEKSKKKILVVYLSDHGEAIGENNQWGHGFLNKSTFEVPILIQSFNEKLPFGTRQLPVNLPQYNLSLYLLNQMGIETNQKATSIPKDFSIYGNDIDGFAGKALIEYGLLNQYKAKIIP